jgi:hypothetical protein
MLRLQHAQEKLEPVRGTDFLIWILIAAVGAFNLAAGCWALVTAVAAAAVAAAG